MAKMLQQCSVCGELAVVEFGLCCLCAKQVKNIQTGGSTPSQYALPKEAIELQDLIEHRNMDFSTGNIFKATYRLGTKDGVSLEYDLNKIIYFAKRKLAELERVANNG
jgi:hypothetical protein